MGKWEFLEGGTIRQAQDIPAQALSSSSSEETRSGEEGQRAALAITRGKGGRKKEKIGAL